jgi:hypothetical protein
LSDALTGLLRLVKDPVAAGNQLRAIGDLIHGDEADSEGAHGAGFVALVGAGDQAEAVEVAPMGAARRAFPPFAFVRFGMAAVTEPAIVLHNQGVLADVEGEGSDAGNIVGILEQLVGKGGEALEIPELGAEIFEVVDLPAEVDGGWLAH